MIREYVIYEAVWNKAAHSIRNINDFRHIFGRQCVISATGSLSAITEYITINKDKLNQSITQTPIAGEYMLVLKNYHDMDFFFFAYEQHLSDGLVKKDIHLLLENYYGPKPYVPNYKAIPFKPTNVDPATMRLMQAALPMHGSENCHKCGSSDLKMIRMALLCKKCNVMVGGC